MSGCHWFLSSPSPLASRYPQPVLALPRTQPKGKSKGRLYFFPRQAGARPLATENTQPEDTGIQLFPSSSQEHAVQKPQSHDSEHISSKKLWDDPLSLHRAQATWNYIPYCFLPLPCPHENLNPSNPIVPYSLSPSFWFCHAVSAFHPTLYRNRMLPSFTSTLSAHHSVAAQRQDANSTGKKKKKKI